MDSKDETFLILEQYRIYSEAKEKFIERQFTTNRFYLVLNLILLITIYALTTLTPQYMPVIVLCGLGVAIAFLWWINVDSYQMLIKVKYANVLEFLEQKLPEQPYQKEYKDYKEMKKRNNLIVFGDFQKVLTVVVIAIYFIALAYNLTQYVRYNLIF